jgi:hypothetical protein
MRRHRSRHILGRVSRRARRGLRRRTATAGRVLGTEVARAALCAVGGEDGGGEGGRDESLG